MRFAILVALGLIVSSSTLAQTSQSSGNSPRVLGSTMCNQTIPCPDSSNALSTADLDTQANACVIRGLGVGNTDSPIFDGTEGLDADNCMSATNNNGTKNATAFGVKCCVVTLKNSSCSFICQLMVGPQ